MTTSTTDRAAINRRNAQKSTGPRTPEGKNRSRFNAVKHGMTAQTLVLPGEDAHALQSRLESFMADLQSQNEVEKGLIEQAVHASWRLERAERAEVARLSRLIQTMPEAQAQRAHEQALALGFWLFSDRGAMAERGLQGNVLNVLGTAPASGKGPGRLDLLDHPEAIVSRLSSTAAGTQWMLDRWTELRAHLETGRAWSCDQKKKAIRLMGRRAGELEPHDPLQWYGDAKKEPETGHDQNNRASKRRPKPSTLTQQIYDLLNRPVDGPEVQRGLDAQLRLRPEVGEALNEADAIARLKDIADEAIRQLEDLAAEHCRLAAADAATRLSFDASNEGEHLRRYLSSCHRQLVRNLDTLLKIRKTGVAVPDDGEPSATAPAESAETPPVPDPVPPQADRENPRNEPKPSAPTVDRVNPQNEPSAPTVDRVNPQNEPTEDHGDPRAEMIALAEAGTLTANSDPLGEVPPSGASPKESMDQGPTNPGGNRESPQADPAAPLAAEIDHLPPPALRTTIVALTLALVVLAGACAVARGQGKPQNEPKNWDSSLHTLATGNWQLQKNDEC